MEQYFATTFEDVRHERILILLIILVETDILKQCNITDHEIDVFKNLAREKIHRQRILKEHVAMNLLEKQISN